MIRALHTRHSSATAEMRTNVVDVPELTFHSTDNGRVFNVELIETAAAALSNEYLLTRAVPSSSGGAGTPSALLALCVCPLSPLGSRDHQLRCPLHRYAKKHTRCLFERFYGVYLRVRSGGCGHQAARVRARDQCCGVAASMSPFQSRTTSPGAALLSILLLRMIRTSAFQLRPSSLKGAAPAPLVRLRGTLSTAIDSGVVQDVMAGARDDSGAAKAVFLENSGEWVPMSNTEKGGIKRSREVLDGLSLQELRQEAQQRGQKTTGSKKVLVERLFSQEPPGKKGGCVDKYAVLTSPRQSLAKVPYLYHSGRLLHTWYYYVLLCPCYVRSLSSTWYDKIKAT